MAIVISHRTQMGTMPENTLAGIDAAIEGRADAIEIDVRATADGELVLMHDATLERTVGDPREPGEVTLEELRGLKLLDPFGNAGRQPIPSFEETLACVAGRGGGHWWWRLWWCKRVCVWCGLAGGFMYGVYARVLGFNIRRCVCVCVSQQRFPYREYHVLLQLV